MQNKEQSLREKRMQRETAAANRSTKRRAQNEFYVQREM
jgi:hypothetical protein